MFGIEERPSTFSELIGNEHAIRLLRNSLTRGNLANGYVFKGEYGTGKTTMATIFAKAILCTDLKEGGDPCGKCKSCQSVDNCSHPGFMVVDSTNNGNKENVSEIIRTMQLRGFGGRKVYYFEEAHGLSSAARDALLMILETPELSKDVVIILSTTEYHKMPATLLSRCRKVNILLPTTANIKDKLVRICVKRNLPYDDDALHLIAVNSGGHYRNAENDLWGISCDGEISFENARDHLGVYNDDIAEMLVNIRSNIKRSLEISNELVSKIGAEQLAITAYKLLVDTQRSITLQETDGGRYGSAVVYMAKNLGSSVMPMIEFLRGKDDFTSYTNIDADIIILHHKFMRGDFKVVDVPVPSNNPAPESKVKRSSESESGGNLTSWEICERQRETRAQNRRSTSIHTTGEQDMMAYKGDASHVGGGEIRISRS